jgi:S1-C subfamily serine protease
MEENQRLHESLLYPVVRIYSQKAAGSGTVIYCEKDPEAEDEYITLVLTNHHVVDDLIKVEKVWDSVLKRKIDKEVFEYAHVETFDYRRMSTVDSSNRYKAQILAYDKEHDLAILQIESPRNFQYVAPLIPKEEIQNLRLFQEIAVSGCSMAHEPFVNFGQLTYLAEKIENKRYIMYNAGSYFGNSGGALFDRKSGFLIGVPSRLTGIQLGFGIDMVTFMGFAAHSDRVYEFLEDQELCFIWDASDDYHTAMERRETRKKESLLELKAALSGASEAKEVED